jgi:hypothetical protein
MTTNWLLFEESDTDELWRKVFKRDGKNRYVIRDYGGPKKAVIPSFWGGRNYYSATYDFQRTALVMPCHILVGDLILLEDKDGAKLYACASDTMLDLASGERVSSPACFLEGLIACEQYYAVLRPSAVLK